MTTTCFTGFSQDEPLPDKTDPWSDDMLNRQIVAKDFTKILTSINQPQVISLNSTFGMGKTFFVKRWKIDLENKGYIALYFNVWNSDFSDDPLISFVVDLREQLKSLKLTPDESALKGLIETFGQITMEAAKSVTSHLVDADDIQENERTKNTQKNYGYFAETKINAHLNARKGIVKFRQYLTAISRSIAEEKPIYIFIDELDRCRPTFAIEFLEQIKHIFSVPGYTFILSTDRNQLKHSISSVYGQGMDSEGYLRRFIDLDLSLPPPETANFVKYLYKNFELEKIYPPTKKTLACGDILNRNFTEYADFFKVSLREQKQIYAEMNLSLRLMESSGQIIYPKLIGFLVNLKVKHRTIYDRIGQDLIDPNEILDLAEKEAGQIGYHKRKEDGNNPTIRAFLFATLGQTQQAINAKYETATQKLNTIAQDADHLTRRRIISEHKALSEASEIAAFLDRNHLAYDYEKYPILYVKGILDIGAKYYKR